MRTRSMLRAMAWVLLASGVCALSAVSLALASLGSGGEIVFVSDRATADAGEVYELGVGVRPVDVTRSVYRDFLVAASPTGRTVAFWSNRDGVARVLLASADGSAARRVTGLVDASGQYPPGPPQFSPDGSRLAVTRWIATSPEPVSVVDLVDVRTARARRFATRCGSGGPGSAGGVAFSPDGQLLACGGGGAPGDQRVSVYDLAGHQRFTLGGSGPLWSSRGLLSVSTQAMTTTIVDAQGRKVATLAGQARAWSPDGRLLALAAGNRLVVVDLTSPGSRRVLAVHANWTPYWVAFTPDGSRVGFDSPTGGMLVPVAGGPGRRLPVAFGVWSAGGRYAYLEAPRRVVPGARITVMVGDALGRNAHTVGRFLYDDHGASRLVWLGDRRVLYETSATGSGDLYAVRPDGSGLRRLTHDPQSEGAAAWSPDGKRLAYSSSPLVGHLCEGCPSTLWVADAAALATSATQITHGGDGSFDGGPSWSPDGARIVFVHAGYDSSELDVVNADGTGRQTLVRGWAAAPAWSPGGTTIVYLGRDGIDAIDPSGSNQRLLRAFPSSDLPSSIAWSPDGKLLAYTRSTNHANSLYLANADGSGTPRLVTTVRTAASISDPSFALDGTRITFAALVRSPHQDPQSDICVVSLDGSNLHRIAQSPYQDTSPTWQSTVR